jgi:PIN domain nuclease of toxin-antitoxin system
MNLLLDTHALIGFLEDDACLGRQARAAISDAAHRSYVSDATAWEAGIKSSLRKLDLPAPHEELFPGLLEKMGFYVLPIRHEHLHQMVTRMIAKRGSFGLCFPHAPSQINERRVRLLPQRNLKRRGGEAPCHLP